MGKAVTKADIVSAIAEKAEITKAKAKVAYEEFVAITYAGAKSKDGFVLPGLGKFIIGERKARMGRNPKTNETIKIPKAKVLKFRIAKAAKDVVLGKKKK